MLQLFIGNKNYSSWSMRPWVLIKQAGIPFEEILVRFDSFDAGSKFKTQMSKVSPTGKVPALVDGDLNLWDTLAIAEYVAEKYPEKNLWPKDAKARAIARSVCAEMHSGFTSLRSHCGMNIEASLPDIGALIWRDQPGVRADVQRLVEMWGGLLETHKGPMLFGEFSIADAYYAPVCSRITSTLATKALMDAPARPLTALTASCRAQPLLRATSCSCSMLRAPMPRGGKLTTRMKLVSSRGFSSRRRYARACLISARSKNRRPPYTL